MLGFKSIHVINKGNWCNYVLVSVEMNFKFAPPLQEESLDTYFNIDGGWNDCISS